MQALPCGGDETASVDVAQKAEHVTENCLLNVPNAAAVPENAWRVAVTPILWYRSRKFIRYVGGLDSIFRSKE